jgi:hypothetical protein
LSKENHLRGVDNWSTYKNALMLSLMTIGYDGDNETLTYMDQLCITNAIVKTSKRDVLELIDGMKKGTKILCFLGKMYKTSVRIHHQASWREVNKIAFDGGDPVAFISQFKKKMRECKDIGLPMAYDPQIAIFLAATRDKAYGWTRRQETTIRREELSLQNLMDDLVDEFCAKVGKKKSEKSSFGSGSTHSTSSPSSQQSKVGKRRPWRGNRKPAFNDKGEPLCFNCQEYGHMAKDCSKPKRGSSDSGNNRSMAAPLPPGLKDLENQLGSFCVKVGQTRLQEMETLVEICTKQESVDVTRDRWQEGDITTANVRKAEIGVTRKAKTDDVPTTTSAPNTAATHTRLNSTRKPRSQSSPLLP